VDGAGYVYRVANHYPLTGSVPGLPPNFGGWQLYIHRGLDLNGGTHIDYKMTNCPGGKCTQEVQQRTIQVINKRVNALNVSEPEIRGAGNNDRITVDLAGVSAPVVFFASALGVVPAAALMSDATVKCWGDNSRSQLGIDSSGNAFRSTAVSVNPPSSAWRSTCCSTSRWA